MVMNVTVGYSRMDSGKIGAWLYQTDNKVLLYVFPLRRKTQLLRQDLMGIQGKEGPKRSFPHKGLKSTLPSGMACSCLGYSNRGRKFKAVS